MITTQAATQTTTQRAGAAERRQPDILLRPYLTARNDTEASHCLHDLLQKHAQPAVAGALRRQWGGAHARPHPAWQTRDECDAEDASGEAISQLMFCLKKCRTEAGAAGITNFRAYAAATAERAGARILRERRPRRAHLISRLRVLLRESCLFALWQGAHGEWLCGPAFLNPAGAMEAASPPSEVPCRCTGLFQATAALLNGAEKPMLLRELAERVGEELGVFDAEQMMVEDEPCEWVADPQAEISVCVERRLYLQRLWSEIECLPANQRAALLLNLTDSEGHCVLDLLPRIGVAGQTQIAAALGFCPAEWEAIGEEMPWDDRRIAVHLGVSRQQVINLRQAGRARLKRRFCEEFDPEHRG